MKRELLCAFALLAVALTHRPQFSFDPTIDVNPATDFEPTEIRVPASPLKSQILFIGGVDMVETTPTYGNPATSTVAKEWNDFIGFTPDRTNVGLGWISVNHERLEASDMLGDGGGMTVFKVERDEDTDTLRVVNQLLPDGRSGDFFNVDFVNTVGSTGMNCGGITSTVDVVSGQLKSGSVETTKALLIVILQTLPSVKVQQMDLLHLLVSLDSMANRCKSMRTTTGWLKSILVLQKRSESNTTGDVLLGKVERFYPITKRLF